MRDFGAGRFQQWARGIAPRAFPLPAANILNQTQETKHMSQPAHKIKIGRIAATIWNNDGFYSVDVTRAYKDNYDEWKSTNSFSQSDLLNLAKCAERAETWINHKSNSTT